MKAVINVFPAILLYIPLNVYCSTFGLCALPTFTVHHILKSVL